MIRYYKLFDILNRTGMKKSDLRAILSPKTIAKLSKGEYISGEAIEKICKFLKCQPGDIMEYIETTINDNGILERTKKMKTEKEINILISAGRTKQDAEKANCIIYEDLGENVEKYCKEWEYLNNEEENYTEKIRKMVKTGIPMEDWQITIYEGKKYYIEYIL